jgi:hypothetical protein
MYCLPSAGLGRRQSQEFLASRCPAEGFQLDSDSVYGQENFVSETCRLSGRFWREADICHKKIF